MRVEEEGDDGEDARKVYNLPENWRVHSSTNGRLLGWSSPGGRLYVSRHELNVRFGRQDPSRTGANRLPKLELPQSSDTPSKSSKRVSLGLERERGEDEESMELLGKQVDPKPLMELLGSPAESDGVTDKDKQMLARVLATFQRHLRDKQGERQRQATRDNYVMAVFRIYSTSGRSLHCVAQQSFVDAVALSEESRKNRCLLTACRSFQRFWDEIGGYDGTFDEADRETMNMALNVRPLLKDMIGECGVLCHGGRTCNKPNQECITCGTNRLRCASHADHTIQECRGVFWSKHSSKGIRLRTMADFLRPQPQQQPIAADQNSQAPAA